MNQDLELDLHQELEIATILNEQQKESVKEMNEPELFAAIVTQATERLTTKHDPYCDCGICQYCRGDEDKYGKPTREQEVIDLSVAINNTVSIECGECGEHAWETVGTSSSDTRVQDFARTIWKHGWVVKDNIPICPNCRED